MIRPHGETVEYEQELIEDRGNLVISRFTFNDLKEALVIEGIGVLDNGYQAVLFEFFDPPLEIMKIYDRKGNFTGYYCNVNTKPSRFECGYEIVDLYIDIFVLPDMRYQILDNEEFETAVRKGWISSNQESLARATVDRIAKDIEAGDFPPEVVRDFQA
ncbi:MAG: DUF402 domain-containing protein [Thermoplasmata archaeon]